jgi:hypothetical protein
MTRHYGERLFKCRYVNCSFRRHGFNSKESRRSHEKEHEKPWKCDIEGCEFEEGGFLSRKMRDEHLEQFHNHDDILPNGAFGELDENDLEYVCLDLVKANDVTKIRELTAAGKLKTKSYLGDLVACAAQYASPEMMKMLLDQGKDIPIWGSDSLPVTQTGKAYRKSLSKFLISEIVAGNNFKMLEYILRTNSEDWGKVHPAGYFENARGRTLSEVLEKGSDEMLGIFCKWVEQDVLKEKNGPYLVQSSMIAATAGDIYREHILLGLWAKVPSQRWSKPYWKNAMLNVASMTCSIELATFLVNQGVPVDWRNGTGVPTPLVHAARKTDAKAAQLVRFLLFNGAETIVEVVKGYKTDNKKRLEKAEDIEKSQIHVSEQKGAQQISKWLGVTFDELVAEAKKAQGEPKNPDT